MRVWKKLFTGAVLALSINQIVLAQEKITVFAAASLTNALQEIALQYEKDKEVKIILSFASSSTLARQIGQGAPAEIFISADQKWMDYLSDKKEIIEKTRITLLSNELALIAARSSKVEKLTLSKETNWQSLLNGGRLAVGDPDHVPAGIYAKEALQTLGAWSELSPLMARANDVRGALALVERDEAPLGIVYASDAVASQKVRVVGIFPADTHSPVEYPMAMIKQRQTPTVVAFYDYLRTAPAATIFKRYGFTPR